MMVLLAPLLSILVLAPMITVVMMVFFARTHPVALLTIFTSPMVAVLMLVALMVLVAAPMVPMATVVMFVVAPMVPMAIFVPVLSVFANELPVTSLRATHAWLHRVAPMLLVLMVVF